MTKHRGFKIATRITKTGIGRALEVKIDGHLLSVSELNLDRDRAIRDASLYIDDSIERPDAYTWTRDLTSAQLAKKVST